VLVRAELLQPAVNERRQLVDLRPQVLTFESWLPGPGLAIVCRALLCPGFPTSKDICQLSFRWAARCRTSAGVPSCCRASARLSAKVSSSSTATRRRSNSSGIGWCDNSTIQSRGRWEHAQVAGR
jgi:hypothetical protein